MFGALVVNGNATIDCNGGALAFDDSSELEWAEGATLNITGELGSRTIRVGTDDGGLSAAQLNAIAYNGQKHCVTINANGYLSARRPFMLMLR